MVDLLRGIDVSAYQGRINWEILRQARRDIAFAYVRSSEWRVDNSTGGLLDMYAEANIAGANRNGILTGIYQRANLDVNTPEKEAIEFVARMKYLNAWQPGNLIPAIDVEYTAPTTKNPSLNQWVRDFIDAYFGLSPVQKLMFYTSSSYVRNYYDAVLGQPNVSLWVAHTEKYSVPKGVPAEQWAGQANTFAGQGLIHQYTHSLTIPGISENTVDGNCLFPNVRMYEVMV